MRKEFVSHVVTYGGDGRFFKDMTVGDNSVTIYDDQS